MATHFLHSASLLLIQTCHKRGAHAMGGMMAQIPVKADPEANEAVLAKVLEDKERSRVCHLLVLSPLPFYFCYKRQVFFVPGLEVLVFPVGIVDLEVDVAAGQFGHGVAHRRDRINDFPADDNSGSQHAADATDAGSVLASSA